MENLNILHDKIFGSSSTGSEIKNCYENKKFDKFDDIQ